MSDQSTVNENVAEPSVETKPVEVESTEIHGVEHLSYKDDVKETVDTTVVTSTESPKKEVSGTLSDLDEETQEKARKAFAEHGLDYDASLNNKNSSTFTDPAQVVKDFDKLDPETQEKIRKAFNDPKVKSAIANNDAEAQLNLEKEMDKLRKEINWDLIEKDSDGIPILNNDDIVRIVGIGASTKDDIRIIIQSACASIKTARTEIPTLKTKIDNIVATINAVPSENEAPLSEDSKKRFAAEKDTLDRELKSNEELEKSSLDTLAVFQDLSRKTVQELIDDNSFVKALSVISTKICLTTFDDARFIGYCTSVFKELNNNIKENYNNKEFEDFIYSAINPFVDTRYGFFDAYLDMIYSLNNFEIEKAEKDIDRIDGIIIKKLMNFAKNIDSAAKYPFMISSRYCNRVDSIFNPACPVYDNAEKEKIGWPTKEEIDPTNIAELECAIDSLESYINKNYDIIRENIKPLYSAALIYINQLQCKKKNTFVKKVYTYSSFLFIESIMQMFDSIIKGTTQKLIKAEDGTDKYETEKLTDEEIKRYIYLAFTYIILLTIYTKNNVKINAKLSNHKDLQNQAKSANEVIRYINSEFFLGIDIIHRFDINKVTPVKVEEPVTIPNEIATAETESVKVNEEVPAEYSIKTFIDKAVYKNLGEEVLIAFKELDVTKARHEMIKTNLSISSTVIDITRKILTAIAEDNGSDIFSTPK